MISILRKTSSLRNFRSGLSGQISTLLILIMVAALIFILVTVNLGKVSLTATTLSNAADTGSLTLASQLATKSHMLEKALGGTKKCEKGGILGTILAVVLAIVAVALAAFTGGGSLVLYGAIGGAIGGGIGAAVLGQNVLSGMVSGAAIGAAIGFGASFFAPAAAPAATAGSAGAGAGAGASAGAAGTGAGAAGAGAGAGAGTAGAGAAGAGTAGTATGAAATGTTVGTAGTATGAAATGAAAASTSTGAVAGAYTTSMIAGNVGMAALSAGASIYSGSVSDRMQSASLQNASRQLNGLPEYDRYREGTFLQVLSQTVDDPNTIEDIYDVNSNGDVKEKVPYFSHWWYMRTEDIKTIVPILRNFTSEFVDGPLTTFRDYASNPYTQACFDYSDMDEYSYAPKQICNPKYLSRQEVEGEDGAIVALLRGLEKAGYDVSFWQPGGTTEDPAEDNDELDNDVTDLADFVAIADAIKAQDKEALTSTWQTWVKAFYDSESDGDSYEVLGNMVYGNADKGMKGLNGWRAELISIRNSLPDCVVVSEVKEDTGEEIYASNPPCKYVTAGEIYGTLDSDLTYDEFTPVLTAIDELKNKIESFLPAIQNYYNNMSAQYATLGTSYGGLNPVTYSWATEDSAGKKQQHMITAQVGNFKLPSIQYSEHSCGWFCKEKCQELKDYSDNGSNTWVRVTRKEPANAASGIAGKWNPYDNDDPLDPGDSTSDGWFSISKISRAKYSYDNVGLAGTK